MPATEGEAMTPDEMILRGPDEPHQIGTEDGDTCGRYASLRFANFIYFQYDKAAKAVRKHLLWPNQTDRERIA